MKEINYPIIINNTHYIGNNKYKYNFPLGSVSLKNSSIALQSVNMYYSWPNIDKFKFNNALFTIAFPDGGAYTYYAVTIPTGFYSIEDINGFLQKWFIEQGLYLIDDKGENVYYVEFLTNIVNYAIQLNIYTLPSILPSGWINPGNITLPAIGSSFNKPIVTIGDSNDFGKLIGFSPGDYSDDSQISDLTPQISPVQSIIIQCNFLNNKYSNPANNLFVFTTQNIEYGQMISINPYLSFIDLLDASTDSIEISFVDQNYRELDIKDTNLTIQLIIKIEK